jgi:hypothetical protein
MVTDVDSVILVAPQFPVPMSALKVACATVSAEVVWAVWLAPTLR